jgi:protein kinase C substrate 80K-H
LIGTYSSIEEKDDATVVMKFGNGQHCHAFGPRTADVSIRCGSENKLLSASEPSTCFYTFDMESPAACTKKFAEYHGIN